MEDRQHDPSYAYLALLKKKTNVIEKKFKNTIKLKRRRPSIQFRFSWLILFLSSLAFDLSSFTSLPFLLLHFSTFYYFIDNLQIFNV